MLTKLSSLLLVVLPGMVLAYSSGPPNGLTGAPGEGNCTQCHNSYALNSGDGSLSIAGPNEYVPGETYNLQVILADPGQSRWGFELTTRGEGNLSVVDTEQTQISTSGNIQYLKHTSTGTNAGTADGPVTWDFAWTAPADSEDPIRFYAAGLGSDQSFSPSGDYVYTTDLEVTSAVESVADQAAPATLELLGNYPNPFNPTTEIHFNLSEPGEVRLEVVDMNGSTLARLASGHYQQGMHQVSWQAENHASGIYLARLTTSEGVQLHRMLLLK